METATEATRPACAALQRALAHMVRLRDAQLLAEEGEPRLEALEAAVAAAREWQATACEAEQVDRVAALCHALLHERSAACEPRTLRGLAAALQRALQAPDERTLWREVAMLATQLALWARLQRVSRRVELPLLRDIEAARCLMADCVVQATALRLALEARAPPAVAALASAVVTEHARNCTLVHERLGLLLDAV